MGNNLIAVVVGVVTAGGFIGYVEQQVGGQIINALTDGLLFPAIDEAMANPAAQQSPGLVPLLWLFKFGWSFGLWWGAGIGQAIGLWTAFQGLIRRFG